VIVERFGPGHVLADVPTVAAVVVAARPSRYAEIMSLAAASGPIDAASTGAAPGKFSSRRARRVDGCVVAVYA
jgi:hypothetical protein